MNGGQGCRMVEESAWEAGPPLVPDIESDAPASAERQRRSSVDTMPASDPFSMVHPARPEWCVDVGEALLSMTTFELWSAIERSQVAPWMRAWREGMECWTEVQEIPELEWAVASAPRWEPAPAEPQRAEVMLPPPREAPPRAEAYDDVQDLAHRDTTPAPARLGSLDGALEVTPTPFATEARPRPPRDASGVRWLTGGAMVAVAALAFAIVRTVSGAMTTSTSVHAAAPPRAEAAAVAAVAPPAPEVAAASAAPATSASAPVVRDPVSRSAERFERSSPRAMPRRAVRREERGQRRLPRGGRRAYGR